MRLGVARAILAQTRQVGLEGRAAHLGGLRTLRCRFRIRFERLDALGRRRRGLLSRLGRLRSLFAYHRQACFECSHGRRTFGAHRPQLVRERLPRLLKPVAFFCDDGNVAIKFSNAGAVIRRALLRGLAECGDLRTKLGGFLLRALKRLT